MIDRLPEGVTRDEFCRVYASHLVPQRPALIENLRRLLARSDFSSPVDEVDLGVFPDESGDGHVSVWCYFRGRNPRVSSTEPSLFAGKAVRLTEGFRVPTHDPNAYDFHTGHATVDVVLSWVRACWAEAGGDTYPIPATATGHDDCCGTTDSFPLNSAARAREESNRRRRTKKPS